MNSGQRRQLNVAITPVHELIAELSPTIIEPSKEKQKALGVADFTMLFRIGVTRIITLYPIELNHWNLKHFRSDAGELSVLREEDLFMADAGIPARALVEGIAAIDEQLEDYRTGGIPDPDHDRINTTLQRLVTVLRNRQALGAAAPDASALVSSSEGDFDDF
ncbi:MAG: hypothetical protein ACOH1T_03665 [Microbacteriaceae bacterium]